MSASKQTLCWDCAKAIGDCHWSKYLKPIKGWKVEEVHKSTYYGFYNSYLVLECPEFKRDGIGGGVKRYEEEQPCESGR